MINGLPLMPSSGLSDITISYTPGSQKIAETKLGLDERASSASSSAISRPLLRVTRGMDIMKV
jgi:hypothetical protein